MISYIFLNLKNIKLIKNQNIFLEYLWKTRGIPTEEMKDKIILPSDTKGNNKTIDDLINKKLGYTPYSFT